MSPRSPTTSTGNAAPPSRPPPKIPSTFLPTQTIRRNPGVPFPLCLRKQHQVRSRTGTFGHQPQPRELVVPNVPVLRWRSLLNNPSHSIKILRQPARNRYLQRLNRQPQARPVPKQHPPDFHALLLPATHNQHGGQPVRSRPQFHRTDQAQPQRTQFPRGRFELICTFQGCWLVCGRK